MKVVKTLAIILFVGMIATACSEQNRTVGEVDQDQQQTEPQQQPIEQAVTETQEGPSEFSGMVMETEKGIALVTDNDTYLVTGQDLSSMMGKRIKVTGTLTTSEDTQVLDVLTVLPLE
jgi:PBP1b-binding outer membrane lipoprotein LpoB